MLSPIHMLWVSGELPWHARASIASFLKHGHEVHLWSYDLVRGLPRGCTLMPADEVIGRDGIFTYKSGAMAGHLSGFADCFRYELLSRFGGWWSDCDMLCVKPFDAGERPYVFASVWEPATPKYVNNNVIFVREPKSEIMAKCADVASTLGSNALHAEAGPVLLHRLVHELGLGQWVEPPEIFNPIQYGDVRLLFERRGVVRLKALGRKVRGLRPIQLSSSTRGVHLFSAMVDKHLGIKSLKDIRSNSVAGQIISRLDVFQ